MSLRQRVSGQQLLAVSFAVIMLVSMGGMAFVGGAGAQTGGTADEVFDEEQDASTALNISAERGSVSLIGPNAAGGGVDGVTIRDDGRIDISGAHSNNGEFAGVELSPDRVAAVTDTQADPANQADFLNDIPNEFAVESSGDVAFPAIFVEYDPQSEFSQIEGSNGIGSVGADANGEHDFIVIAHSDNLNGITDATVDISGNDVVALSVDNDDVSGGTLDASDATQATVLAEGADFGTVASELTGTAATDLQNSNIDDVQFTAGAFGVDGGDTIQQVMLADDIASTGFDAGGAGNGAGETIHSEKITLVNETADDRFFSSIDGADEAAADGDTIVVDNGEYSAVEDVSAISTANLTIKANDETNVGDDLTTRIDNVDSTTEAIVVDQLGSGSVAEGLEVDGLVIRNDDNVAAAPTVDLSGSDNLALTNAIIQHDATDGSAVNYAPSDNAGAVTDNAIVSPNRESFDTATGLDLSATTSDVSADVSGNLLVGFQTQVNAAGNTDMDALLNNHADQFAQTEAQAAVVANDTIANGGVVQADKISGSLEQAVETDAANGDIVEVYSGVYDEGDNPATITADTDDISIVGADSADRPEIVDSTIDLNGAGDVALESVVFSDDQDTTSIGALGGGDTTNVTVADVDLDDESVTVDDAANTVTLQSLTNVGTDGITVDTSDTEIGNSLNEVVVDDVSVDIDAGTGVEVTNGGSANAVTDVTVSNATVTGSTAGGDGILVNVLDTNEEDGTYIINNNDVTDIGDGIGIDITNTNEGRNAEVNISRNQISGGSDHTGLRYELGSVQDVTITDNIFTGADVTGGQNSVGVNFVDITGLGADPFTGAGSDTVPFQNNTITNHARLIQEGDSDPVISSAGYNALIDSSAENTFGTLVLGPDNSYNGTYGNIADDTDVTYSGGAASYLPGSINEAVDLVEGNDDLTKTTLEVKKPTVNAYVDEDVTVGPEENITIQGESRTVTAETRFVLNGGTAALNNHQLQRLTIEHTTAGTGDPAIEVDADNAQSSFSDLTVTTNNVGFDVNADNSDVNVIELRDSQFTIEGDNNGVVLASGAGDADDRDGYVVDNVSIDGTGISNGATGLDLTDVDKPGKTDPALETELTVQEVDVSDFEKQLELSTDLTDISGVDAESVLDGDATNEGASNNVTITAGDFDTAVLVFDETNGARDGLQNEEVIYGSLDTAEDESGAAAILDVRAGEYGEDVDLGTNADVIVEGPAAGVETDNTFRDTLAEEAVINGDVDMSGNDVTVDGLSILADGVGIDVQTANTVNIDNTAITTDTDAATAADGVAINADADVSIDGSFIGDHNGADAVATGVSADSGGAQLSISSDTQLDGGSGTGVNIQNVDSASTVDIDGTVVNFATGVFVTDDPTVAIDGTIADNTERGVDVAAAADVTVSDIAEISRNGAAGILMNDVDATLDVDQATVADNGAAGIQLDAVDGENTDVTRTTFNGNDVGVAVTTDADTTANLTVLGNKFTGDDAIASDERLDGTLNYFNDRKGPATDAGASVDDTVVYDPFLTESLVGEDLADIRSTTYFAHDVVVPASDEGATYVSVGFPAEPAEVDGETPTLGDYIDNDGKVFTLEDGQFTQADPTKPIDAFDAVILENTGDEPRVAAITYQNERDPTDTTRNELQFDEGLNFVAPQQAGTVDQALFPGGPTDSVVQVGAPGQNLYGDFDAAQVRDGFTNPDSAQAFGNFRSGVGDATVHPHAGYLVTVNEDSNVNLSVTERIPTAAGPTEPVEPTADNVADRTDATSGTVTNIDTGASYTSLTEAVSEVDDSETLELGAGVFEPVGGTLTVDNDDVTIRGADTTATIIDADVDAAGDNVRVQDLTVEGDLTTSGTDVIVQQVNVVANSPGGSVTVSGSAQLTNADIENTLTVEDGANADVRDSTFRGLDNSGTADFTFAGEDTQVLTDGDDLSAAAKFGTNDRVVLMPGDYTGNGAEITSEDTTLTSAPQAGADDVVISGTAPDVLQASADGVAIEDVTVQIASGETGVTLSDTGATLDGVVFESQADDTTYVDDGTMSVDLDAVIAGNTFDQQPAVDGDTVVVRSNIDVYNVDQQVSSATIQDAVDSANDGDTIEVSDGDYSSVSIDTANLTLESVNGADSTSITDTDTDAVEAVSIQASGVTVDGFTIERTGASEDGTSAQAIAVRAADGGDAVEIKNNIIETDSTVEFAVYVRDGGSGGLVTADNAVDNVEITSNTINAAAGDFEPGTDDLATALNNADHTTAIGVASLGETSATVSDVEVNNNDVSNADIGFIAIDGDGELDETTVGVTENTFTDVKQPLAGYDVQFADFGAVDGNVDGNGDDVDDDTLEESSS